MKIRLKRDLLPVNLWIMLGTTPALWLGQTSLDLARFLMSHGWRPKIR